MRCDALPAWFGSSPLRAGVGGCGLIEIAGRKGAGVEGWAGSVEGYILEAVWDGREASGCVYGQLGVRFFWYICYSTQEWIGLGWVEAYAVNAHQVACDV